MRCLACTVHLVHLVTPFINEGTLGVCVCVMGRTGNRYHASGWGACHSGTTLRGRGCMKGVRQGILDEKG